MRNKSSFYSIFADPVASSISKATCATLPFVTIGMLDSKLILIASIIVGLFSALMLLLRIAHFKNREHHTSLSPVWARILDDILSLPYAVLLSSTICIQRGIDAYIGVWFSIGMALYIITGNLVSIKGR